MLSAVRLGGNGELKMDPHEWAALLLLSLWPPGLEPSEGQGLWATASGSGIIRGFSQWRLQVWEGSKFSVFQAPSCMSEFAQEDQGESSKAKLAGGTSENSGFCCSFFFFFHLEKQVFIPLLMARWREQTQPFMTQSIFYHMQKTRWRLGSVRHLSVHHFHLSSERGRHHPYGFPPTDDFILQLWAEVGMLWGAWGKRAARP